MDGDSTRTAVEDDDEIKLQLYKDIFVLFLELVR